MCGIFAYFGPETDAATLVFNGLRELEYRGYDSWGVAVSSDGKAAIDRQLGKLPPTAPSLPQSSIGIGHTRWATTGKVSVANAHPHTVRNERLAIVHNGVVENFTELRDEILSNGYALSSETDTEVIGALIDHQMSATGVPLTEAVKTVTLKLKGLGAFVVADLEAREVVAYKVGSPLYAGRSGSTCLLASDPSAILPHTTSLYRLKDGEGIVINADGVEITTGTGSRISDIPFTTFSWNRESAALGDYAHYLDKEISEQPAVLRTLANDQEGCAEIQALCSQSEDIWLTGCGTAYYAALFGSYLLGSAGGPRARAVHAHELPYLTHAIKQSDCVLALSQSGETIDVLDAIKAAREHTQLIGALVNVPGSSLVHEVCGSALLNAGPEKAVLSTKALIAKLARLTQVALGDDAADVLRDAAYAIDGVISGNTRSSIMSLGTRLATHEHLFVLGNGLLHPMALEGALKIKEVSYVHAEGFPAGDLKHGVIALIEDGTPVIALVPEGEQRERIITALEEVRARGARVIGIAQHAHPIFEEFIPVDAKGVAFAIASVTPMQLLGYSMAMAKDLDPDKPRNLAKSVTVR